MTRTYQASFALVTDDSLTGWGPGFGSPTFYRKRCLVNVNRSNSTPGKMFLWTHVGMEDSRQTQKRITHHDRSPQGSLGWLAMLQSYMPQVSTASTRNILGGRQGWSFISNASDRNTMSAGTMTQAHSDGQ